MLNNNTIGENIRRYRKKANLSQEQLAKALDISPATLSAYETDKTVPPATIIAKLALFFSTSTDSFLPAMQPETPDPFSNEI